MAPIRRSNRARKPRVYWNPTITPPHQRQPSAFTIYTEPPEDPSISDNNLSIQLSAQLHESLTENLLRSLTGGLNSKFFNKNLDTEPDKNLGTKPDKDLGTEPDKDLGTEPNEDLGTEPDEDLGTEPDEDLGTEPDEDLGTEPDEDLGTEPDKDLDIELKDQLYQPQFLPKDRAGKPQNLPEDLDSVKLFQLFFPVKEIENIVKQTNLRATYINFKDSWKPLTVTEVYRYLGCLVYIGVQPLRELNDHWQLKSPIASCFNQRRFKQIQCAFTIRDPNTSPEQPEDPWWFRVEPLATTIRKACQKYWIPGAHLAVDECMIPYFGHTRHTIKAPHKPIKQGYKLWALGDYGYIFNWLWYSKAWGTEGLGSRSGQNSMADTQTLVISLAKSLPNPAVQDYILYLDNLFTNIPLANALGELGIGVMGTTRVNALGLPLSLVQLKHAKESLKWGHLQTAIASASPPAVQPASAINCFLWQDNNRVLGETIIYNYLLLAS
jgi:hypothetical protein